MPEVTFESLAKDIKETKTLVASFVADHERDEGNPKTEQEKEAKKAQDEKEEEEKKEAKKASALKRAMDEKDPKERDAAIRKAMDEDEHKKDANDEEKEKEASDEEKEKEAQIASIISDKRQELITKILQANTIVNPNNIKEIDTRLKKASITEIEKEWGIVKSFVGNVDSTQQSPQQKFIPFYANITPQDVDASSLTASSPDSDFANISTEDLLKELRQ